MKQISLQQAAVALVLFLGVGLLLATGQSNGPTVGVSPSAIAASIEQKSDHVDALELAKRIIEGKKDFVVVDLRPAWQFDDYHIPGAINMSLEQALSGGVLSKDKDIILYSSGGTHAAQAWVLLVQQGYRAKTLLDGLQGWWRDVITPVSLSASDESSETPDYQAMKSIREYFQGAAPSVKPTVPSAAAPARPIPPAPSAKPAAPKAKGGGC